MEQSTCVGFYCNRWKGHSGSIILVSWTGFSGSPSLLDTIYGSYLQDTGICHSQSVQSTQLTEIYLQRAFCGTFCFAVCYVHVELLPQFTIFVKPKLTNCCHGPWGSYPLVPSNFQFYINKGDGKAMFVFAFELIVSVKEQFSTFWSTTEASISSQKNRKEQTNCCILCDLQNLGEI